MGGGDTSNCNSGGENSFIYINNGTSLVKNSTWKGDLVNVWASSIALGDVDLDGDLDLALTGASSIARIAKIYINNGTGFAENSTWEQELMPIYDGAIALGDVNNDNKLDLTLTGNDGTNVIAKVYINNGNSFIENTTWQQDLLGVDSSAISFGDYDNNGWLDLTLIGHTSHDNHEIYNNTGTMFEMMQTEAAGTGDLAGIFEGTQGFGGYDNDGYLDLITSGEEQYTTLYLYNISSFRFTTWVQDPEKDIFNTAFGPSTAWGDLDNDNDLDLVLIGVDSSDITRRAAVYINNITTKNTKPTPPTILNATYQNGQLTLRWNNGSDAETPSTGLYYNLKVGASANKHSIVSGVYGGGDDNGYFGNMMQRKSITLNVALNAGDSVLWSVQTIDTALANGSWSLEQNYTIPIDTTTPIITLNSPINGFNTSNPIILFNATIFDDNNLTNVTLYGNWTGSLIANESNTSGINNTYYVFAKDLTVFGDGMYSWLITAEDNANNTAASATRIVRIDTTYPQVNISSPANASTWSSSATVTFTYNVTDTNTANCSLIINNAVDQTDTSVTVNIAQTFTKSLSNAVYTWSVNCTDYAGLQNNSETRTVTVSYTAPSDGGSSSGGGGSGGGGGGGSGSAKETQTVSAQAGEEKTVSFTKDFGVTEIAVTPINKLSSVSLTVEEAKAADSSVTSAGPTGSNVFKYLKITSKAVLEKAKIKFKVSLSWFVQQDYDENTVALKHYTDKWESLPTEKISRDSKYAYYEAETSSLSLFAITAEKKTKEAVKEEKVEVVKNVSEEVSGNVTIIENVSPEIVKENISEEAKSILPKSILQMKWYLLLLVFVIIVEVGYLVYLEVRKK